MTKIDVLDAERPRYIARPLKRAAEVRTHLCVYLNGVSNATTRDGHVRVGAAAPQLW